MTTATLAVVGTVAAILAAVLLLLASLRAGADAETRDKRATADRAAIRTQMQDGLGDVRVQMQDGLAAANTDREEIRTELGAVRTEMRDGFAAVLSRLPAETPAETEIPAPAGTTPDRPAERIPLAASKQ